MGDLGSPWVIPVALVVGCLIGAVGIGGVLLPPTLILLDGVNAHVAIATSIWCFFFAAIAGTVMYVRRGSVDRRAVMLLMTTSIPAAIGGALASGAVPGLYLTAGLAALILGSGCYALFPSRFRGDGAAQSPAAGLVSAGAVVGFGSGLLGSSGPVFVVPILVLMGVRTILAIGVSQVIQLPIVIFATATFAAQGMVKLVWGIVLGVPLIVGVVVGARVAHALQADVLRRVVAVALLGTGVFLAVRLAGV